MPSRFQAGFTERLEVLDLLLDAVDAADRVQRDDRQSTPVQARTAAL
jgi:hypothetical protein